MPTEVISTVRASGGDYSSLSAWEAGEQTNLVSADEIAIAEIREAIDGSYSSGGLDIAGWTHDATHYCEIRAESGYEYDFVNGTGAELTGSGTYGFVFRDGHYLHITSVGITINASSHLFYPEGDGLQIDRCYVDVTKECSWLSPSASQFVVLASLFESSSSNNNARIYAQYVTGVAKNTTFIQTNASKAFGIAFQGVVATNCCAYRPSGTYSYAQFHSCTGDYNAQNNIGSAPPGSNSITTLTTGDFENFASGDYHAASSSVLIDAGTNLYSDLQYDIDGDEYPSSGAWPIGFDYVAGGGGVSGIGDLVGAGSEVVGTGTRTVTGTGALEGQGAEVVGTATRTITGTGALVGQGSDVTGTGAAGGTHTGTGDLVGAGSEIVGVGERAVTGTGALVAQGSAVAGVGERTVTGSGDLVGAGAEVSGSGAIGGITTGTGDLVGAGSEIVGTGLRTVTGSGALVAQGSAVTGTGERTVTGAGALVGSGSEIVGAGVGGDVTTGAGALVGQGSAVTGTGTRTITGVGELVAAGSIIVGSGLRTITGSGVLVGAGSAVTGSSAHAFVSGNTRRTWLLSPRGREWSLSRSN